jgi:hypothetical protein
MAFSGHRTASMLKRYDIIDVTDLRAAAERGSTYAGEAKTVAALRPATSPESATAPEPQAVDFQGPRQDRR